MTIDNTFNTKTCCGSFKKFLMNIDEKLLYPFLIQDNLSDIRSNPASIEGREALSPKNESLRDLHDIDLNVQEEHVHSVIHLN